MSTVLLEPVLVAIYPRWTEAAEVVTEVICSSRDHATAIAIAEDEGQADLFRTKWRESDIPLLLFRTTPQDSATLAAEAVKEISGRFTERPIGVLIADGPEVTGFREERRRDWNHLFAGKVVDAVVDVQVFEFARSWVSNPPRVR